MSNVDEKDAPGFHLAVRMLVDHETGEEVTLSANAPRGSSAAELGAILATLREAGWYERIATNERILERGRRSNEYRAARVAEFKAAGKPVDDEAVAEEDALVNASIAKLGALVDADKSLLNGAH